MTVSRAVVTGATGFLGAHLTRLLLDAGASVTLLVRPSSDLGKLRTVAGPALARASIKQVDITATDEVRRAVDDAFAEGPSAVFHLAGDARARAPDEDEAAMLALHAGSASSLGEATLAAGVRLVAVSTSDVYGKLPSPHDACGPLDPRTPYARSKAAADEILLRMHRERGLDAVILRPYLVYGPAQAPRQLLPALIAACLDERPLPMTDGTQLRDFVFVLDAARAILLAGDAPQASGRAIDICTGAPTRILDAARAVEALLEPRSGGAVPGAVPLRPHEPDAHFGDPAPAAAWLGWRPEVPLKEGLERTIAAFKAARAAVKGEP